MDQSLSNLKDDDGFIRVHNKRKAGKSDYKNVRVNKTLNANQVETKIVNVSKDQVLDKIKSAYLQLKDDEYLRHFERMFKSCVSEKNALQQEVSPGISSIVCYGLGNFSSCSIARYQLALLQHLCQLTSCNQMMVHIYDPIFTDLEKSILSQELNLNLITENEMCRRRIEDTSDGTNSVLFYMPHLDKSLYNNLLWANWNQNQLDRICILGNSFSNILLSIFPDRLAQNVYPYLFHAVNTFGHFLIEHKIPNSFQYKDAFNDLAFQMFNIKSMIGLENEMKRVYHVDQPQYQDQDEMC